MILPRLAAAVAVLSALAWPLPGARAAGDQIAEARALLARAGAALRAADLEDARRDAIGLAITAHETALSALRAALRATAVAERARTAEIDAEAETLRRLLGGLESLSRAPASALLAVRGGPLQATRAAMLLGAVAPEIDRRVAALNGQFRALEALRARQEGLRQDARTALAGLQELRAATAEALGRRDRAGLADRATLTAQARAAAARARDLDGLAAVLAAAPPQARARAGAGLPPAALPVAGEVTGEVTGEVVAGFGAPDPWGRPGHGWSIAAPAFAQVTAPWDATVRYAGPLIDYGQVVVLEPAPDYLLVIAGMARLDCRAGEAVLAGERLGDLGGALPTDEEFLREAASEGMQIGRKTIYLEIRRSGTPLDPKDLFDPMRSEASR